MERLNKYLAHAGVGSRRYCEELITRGRIRVGGQIVRELGTKVEPGQEVTVDGQPLQTERLVYWLLNKPVGYLCTNHDPAGRPRAIDLMEHISQRVYTVGRLDEDSEGLLLLTNDGDLAHKLMHPRFGIEKTYLVQVAGFPTHEDLGKLLTGVWLSDGHVKAKRIKKIKNQGESTWLEIVLAEGKNREIRRMLAQLEHKVIRLKRIAIGPVELGRLRSGKSRPLPPADLARLQRAVEPKTSRRAEGKSEVKVAEPKPPRRTEIDAEKPVVEKRRMRRGEVVTPTPAGQKRPPKPRVDIKSDAPVPERRPKRRPVINRAPRPAGQPSTTRPEKRSK